METCRTCAKCDFDNETQWFDLFNAPRWQLEMERIHLELNTWKIKVSFVFLFLLIIQYHLNIYLMKLI